MDVICPCPALVFYDESEKVEKKWFSGNVGLFLVTSMRGKTNYSNTQAIADYCLNRFVPWIIIGTICLHGFSFLDWRPYCVFCILWYVERNCYNMGYCVCFCKERGIIKFGPNAHRGP